MVGPEVQSVLTGAVSALVYSLVFYAKKRAKSGAESLDFKKLTATLAVGVVVGAAYGYYGIPITQPSVTEQLATYAGTIALVESGIKTLYRAVKQQQSK